MRIDRRWGRAYFAAQALGGALWWLLVFTVPVVREATLGSLDAGVVAVADIPLFVVGSALAALGVRPAAFVAAGWTVLVAVLLAGYGLATGQAGWGVLVMAAAAGGSLLTLPVVILGRVPTEWLVRGPFAFRPAGDGLSTAGVLGRTALQIAVFTGVLLGVVPILIALAEQRLGLGPALPAWSAPDAGGVRAAAIVGGLGLLAVATALGLTSSYVMSTRGRGTPLPAWMPQRLVVAGPYRWVRNPMAVAGIAQGVAVGVLLWSWLVVVYAVAGAVIWHVFIRPHEERDLAGRFGGPYERYRRAVSCWIPRATPFRPEPGEPVAIGSGQASV